VSVQASYLIHNGSILGLAGGPVSLSDAPRSTRRLSRVEFNESTNLWEVRTLNDRLLHSAENYNSALEWETEHFNQLIRQVTTIEEFESLT
jgi:hypothetical protein